MYLAILIVNVLSYWAPTPVPSYFYEKPLTSRLQFQ